VELVQRLLDVSELVAGDGRAIEADGHDLSVTISRDRCSRRPAAAG
jgi:hypothetical protein